jgi:RNA-binding protein PNO1
MPKATKATEREAQDIINADGDVERDLTSVLAPVYAPLGAAGAESTVRGTKAEYRKVNVPAHRFAPLKEHWMSLYEPVTKQMKIDMRMNLKLKKVELKTTGKTEDEGALQKSADFVQAFLLGFEVQDAVALLRLDDLFLECFEVKDVKTLRGEHMSRGIGRLAGKNGKTKFTIENATRTRIVIADQHIRILGSFQNIKIARDAICSLILGSPPGKVYSRLRSVTARLAERF